MINYKKANVYFAKQIKNTEVFIWRPPLEVGGGTWIADRHIAVFYHDQPLPFDPSRAKELPEIKKILSDAKKAENQAFITPFLYERDKKLYCVLRGHRMVRKDFVDIFGTDLFFDKNLYVSTDKDSRIVGFACGYSPDGKIWEVFRDDQQSCD